MKKMNYSEDRKAILQFILAAGFIFAVSNSTLSAQTARDYFVNGANLYIDSKIDEAKQVVEEGISKYPDDKKLSALRKKIEEEKKDKDQNQNQNQDKQENQNKDDQKDQNKNQQQDKNDQRNENSQDSQQQPTVSKEDAQRLLDALANDEKKVQEKVKEAKAARARVRTLINW